MDPETLSKVAALIADPTRAEMLLTLMSGTQMSASDLAATANVSPSTASHHLAELVKGGLVIVTQDGKHRMHRLAGHEVAELLERLSSLGSVGAKPTRRDALSYCRTCYDHLAGVIGVRVREGLENRGVLVLKGESFEITDTGSAFLKDFCIDVEAIRSGRRQFAKACTDWTERVPHIGGALGAAILARLEERRWIVQGTLPRQRVLTPLGSEWLASL